MPAPDFGDYLTIRFVDQDSLQQHLVNHFKTRTLPFAASPLYNAEIIDAIKLTTGEDVKVVYDLALNVEDLQHAFEPGDTIGVLPSNNDCEVDELLNHLNLSSVANRQYLLSISPDTTKKKAAVPSHIPTSGTLREIFLKCLDIRSVPKKLFLRSMIRYTSRQDEIEILQNLCSPSGSHHYNEFISKTKTLLNLLEAFPSCCPPVERLLEYLPPLHPRPYSISSSAFCDQSKKQLHVTFAVVKVNENTKGVCTGWLENCINRFFGNKAIEDDLEGALDNLHIGSLSRNHIPLYFRKNNDFRLPAVPTDPIIMIGPGTGVAPFVGFLEHRFLQPQKQFGTSWLFYGCRYNNRDYLYKHKIQQFQDNGTLTKLSVCFSREHTKTYVQDLIVENMNDFINLVRQKNAIVYVCGDAKNMLKDIRSAIVSCLINVEGLSCDDAETYIKEMEQTRRYVTDIWL